MLSPVHEVNTIEQFSEWVWNVGERFTRGGLYETAWFRGAGNARYHLAPGLYRTDAGKEPWADSELRLQFMRRGIPLVSERPPQNDWDWYFLMQHYRAPTRLLDWTDSALVALYFALASATVDPVRRPAVWALNPFTLNKTSGMEGPAAVDIEDLSRYLPRPYSTEELPRIPVAIDPPLAAQRMVVQHSHFTLHGSDIRGIDEMKNELNLSDDLLRTEIILEDQDDLDYLLRHLAMLGISETSIFPDLEGLSRELRMEYRLDASTR